VAAAAAVEEEAALALVAAAVAERGRGISAEAVAHDLPAAEEERGHPVRPLMPVHQ
jgi:hypothetical protein